MSVNRRQLIQGSAAFMAGSALASAFQGGAFAKAPFVTTQAPGFYRFKVGTAEVIALNDGAVDLPTSVFVAPNPADIDTILAKAGRPGKTVSLSVNAYAVNTGDKLILIDAGAGSQFGPNAGDLIQNFKASGYTPEQVDAVVLTHVHGDHIGGVLLPDGTAAYKNATLLINEKELAFWNSAGNVSLVPEFVRPTFKLMADVSAVYKGRIQAYKDGETVAVGLTAMETPGHTVGHSAIRVGTGKEAVLLWGDVLHGGLLQFPRPDFGFAFDSDQAQAIQTRKKVLDQVTSDGIMIAGVHLGFPGVGNVARETVGYSFNSAFWSPKL